MIALRLGDAEVRFTTREDGDLGLTDGDPVDAGVAAARDGVRRACGLESITIGRQVHGGCVSSTSPAARGYLVGGPADGQVTGLRGAGVAVHVADCLPIAVAGAGGVAMLHAGWRGLSAGVIGAGVAALRGLGVGGPLAAAIGPGVGGCCYEVGADVHEAFGGGAGRIDLKAVAVGQLERAGVGWVWDVELCTLCAPPGTLFSHRRDGPPTGRQAGIAWIR